MSTLRNLVLGLSLLASGSAHAETWQVDATHTRVGFRVAHMMVSSVEGQFPDVTGTLEYTPGASAIDLDVVVQMATVATGNADRDQHLRTSDFLSVEEYPTMTFHADKAKFKKGTFELTGDLTIRGVTKEVTFTGTGLDTQVKDPWGNYRLGASATATIDRTDFGVSWNNALETGGVLVGDDLSLKIDVEFVRPAAPAQN